MQGPALPRQYRRATDIGGPPEEGIPGGRRPGVAREPTLPPSSSIQIPGEGGLRQAVGASRRRREAPGEGEGQERYTILSAEGRRRHPFASAVVAASLYGAKAGDVLEGRRRYEVEEERRKEETEARREERQRRREAADAPAPEGYFRDPVGGGLHAVRRKAKPSPEETERMRQSGYEWSDATGDWKQVRTGEEKVDKWGNEPPKGVKVPPGYQWLPGKGFVKIEKEKDERRTRQQIESGIRALEAQKRPTLTALAAQKRRAGLLRQSAASYRPGSQTYRDAMAAAEEAEAIAAQTESSLAEIDARIQGDYGELQDYLKPTPEGFTWDEFNEMSPQEQAAYRETYRPPPGPRPPKQKSPGEILAGQSP